MNLTFLGTGASRGSPLLGCSCRACLSTDSRDQRLRSAALLSKDDIGVLIDAGPDIRQQLRNFGIKRLDALCLTHIHSDHVAGIDDLSPLASIPLDCFLSENSAEILNLRLPHLGKASWLLPHPLAPPSGFCSGSLPFGYLNYWQRDTVVTGFFWGKEPVVLAYLTDMDRCDIDMVVSLLHGVKTLVLGGIAPVAGSGHLSIAEALQFGETVAAERIVLTHIGHGFEHSSVHLPVHASLAYDGLVLNI